MEVNVKIAVCEDELEVQKMLAESIQKVCPNAEILCYLSSEALLEADEQIDILFLDIQMPKKSGMEVARELRKDGRKTILIFITAIEEYVFQAFDVGAFHYLVKPLSSDKFEEVLKKAIKQYEEMNRKMPEKEEKYLIIKNRGIHTKVLLKDIVYAEVYNRKIILHKMDSDIEYYGKMSDLEIQTGEDFFRSHRAYLIHFKYVEKYDASTIYLEKGKAFMAKQNYQEFVKRYLKYNQRKRKEWQI